MADLDRGWTRARSLRYRALGVVFVVTVATGAGIALLPDLVYRPWSLEGDRIVSRDVSGSLPVVQVGIAWRRGLALNRAARDFIGIAQSSHQTR